MDDFNVKLPLAESYNERNILGATAVAAGFDQRKLNSVYEIAVNPQNGKNTLYLAKRPGVAKANGTFGTAGSTRTAYGITAKPNAAGADDQWVLSVTSGANSADVSDSAGTTTITSGATSISDISRTLISNVEFVVVGVATSPQTFWYSSAIGSWTQITNSVFTALTLQSQMQHMDGYAFVLESFNNNIWNSDLNSLANWTATSFIRKTIQQDRPSALMKYKNQIIAFGRETCQMYANAGNPSGSPLVSIPNLGGRWGATTGGNVIGDRLYWLGGGGGGIAYGTTPQGVFSYNGQTIEKVSTPFIDKMVLEGGQTPVSFPFYGQTAVAIRITSGSATRARWLMFFPQYNEWFEWESDVFTPLNNAGAFLGGSFTGNKLDNKTYVFDFTNRWQDDGIDYTQTHQFRLPGEDGSRHFMSEYGVVGDTTAGAPNLNIAFSDDDDVTFQTARTIDMTKQKKTVFRGGSFYKRTVRITTAAGNYPCRLTEFIARVK